MTPEETLTVINALGQRVAELVVEVEVLRARLATTTAAESEGATDGDR